MVAMTRIFEGVICMAFYAGICYLLLDGAGKVPLFALGHVFSMFQGFKDIFFLKCVRLGSHRFPIL